MLAYRTTAPLTSVHYSPFFDNKLCISTSSNFGLVGNGGVQIVAINAQGMILPERQWTTQDAVFCTAWSEIHENQVVAGGGDGVLRIFDAGVPPNSSGPASVGGGAPGDFPVMAFRGHERECVSVDWNPVSKTTFVSASWDSSLRLWSAAEAGRDNAMMVWRTAQPALVHAVKFSPHDGSVAVSGHGDSAVRVWDARVAGGVVRELRGAHGGAEVLCVDWNKYRPEIIASGAVDKAIKLWDLRTASGTGAPVNEFLGHDAAVKSVAFSPHDSVSLLSTSYDMTARVWMDRSAETTSARFLNHNAQLVKVFNAHTEFVVGCDWSLWGEKGWVATAGWDEKLHVWHV